MQSILQKLYTQSRTQAISEIISLYDQEQAVVINFLYFANIVARWLLATEKTEKQREYKKILLKSDFLLPDGIALQLFYASAKIFGRIESDLLWLNNFNGTDFVPFFLEDIKKKYGSQKLCILLYGTKSEYLQKAAEKLKFQGYNVIYTQEGYSEFDWEKAQATLWEYQDTINILLVARSKPQLPIQELRTNRNYQKIQQNRLIVFNTWGLLDFIAGVQSRAPKIIRKLRLERLYRFITDPKRNAKKILDSLKIFPYIIKYCIIGNKKTS